MNKLDKFSVSYEIWWNKHMHRMNPERNLQTLLRVFAKEKPELIDYILKRFNKHKCPTCDGNGFVNEDQRL